MLLPLLAVSLFASSPAAAEVQAHLESRSMQPGEVVLVVVTGQDAASLPAGAFDQTALDFFRAPSGACLAFFGLDLEISTGAHRLELDLKDARSGRHFWGSDVWVSSKAFPTQELTVEQNYVTPKKEDEARAQQESLVLRGIFSRRTPSRYFEGSFMAPIPHPFSSRFGERRVFNGVPKSPHAGADIRAKTGTKVRATAGGKVVLARSLFYSGNTIILDHGEGVFSYYAHLSKMRVRDGQTVSRGKVIGKVGATGRVTGPHLHWSVRWRHARLDPFSMAALDLDRWLKSRGR